MPEKRSNMPLPPPNSALKSPPKPARKTVSPEAKLAKLGLHTDMDLVLHLPMRYEDETQVHVRVQAELGQLGFRADGLPGGLGG